MFNSLVSFKFFHSVIIFWRKKEIEKLFSVKKEQIIIIERNKKNQTLKDFDLSRFHVFSREIKVDKR